MFRVACDYALEKLGKTFDQDICNGFQEKRSSFLQNASRDGAAGNDHFANIRVAHLVGTGTQRIFGGHPAYPHSDSRSARGKTDARVRGTDLRKRWVQVLTCSVRRSARAFSVSEASRFTSSNVSEASRFASFERKQKRAFLAKDISPACKAGTHLISPVIRNCDMRVVGQQS